MSLFQDIEDHRVDPNKNYQLADIIFLRIAAVLCGAKGWKAIKIFGEAQLDWLKEYGNFSHSIPTKYSIGRIIYPFHLKMHDSAGIRNAFRQGID